MEATLIECKIEPGVFRVEAFDKEGGCDVATFSGPTALERAISFAGTYYDSWADPDGWDEWLSQKTNSQGS